MVKDTTTVVYAGREFELEEPSTDVVIEILNWVGALAVRAESEAARIVRNPTNRAVLFGLLAVTDKQELERLGRLVLQFPTDKEGRKEANAFFRENDLEVAPIVKALMLNLQLSNDLVEALKAFFDGIGGIESLLNLITAPMTPGEESGPGGETPDEETSESDGSSNSSIA